MNKRTTDNLIGELQQLHPEELNGYFQRHAHKISPDIRAFSGYMRQTIKKKGKKQQDVFLAADISGGYGYKLLSEEKHTKQRDVIIRLCLAANFALDEVQRALKLYSFSPLYPRVRRDSVLIVAINKGIYEIAAVNEMLTAYGMSELYACREPE